MSTIKALISQSEPLYIKSESLSTKLEGLSPEFESLSPDLVYRYRYPDDLNHPQQAYGVTLRAREVE